MKQKIPESNLWASRRRYLNTPQNIAYQSFQRNWCIFYVYTINYSKAVLQLEHISNNPEHKN